jgi:hyperosmotically inducible protein
MKQNLILCPVFLLLTAIGCAPAIIPGGAAGGFKTATDERSVGRMWDDATITTRVKVELVKDPITKARKIDVDTLQGVVILTGVVETKEEVKRAGEIAREVYGVQRVKNDLQIGSKTLEESLDKAKLINEPGIRSLNIDVDVNKGIVILTGIVHNRNQKHRVIEIARTTSGTVKVVDIINVKNP